MILSNCSRRAMNNKPVWLVALLVLLCASAARSAEQGGSRSEERRAQPRQIEGDSSASIDWNRALQLRQRSQRGRS